MRGIEPETSSVMKSSCYLLNHTEFSLEGRRMVSVLVRRGLRDHRLHFFRCIFVPFDFVIVVVVIVVVIAVAFVVVAFS